MPLGPTAAVVVLAGGSGTRLGAVDGGVPVNKVHLPLAGRPVLAWSFHWARQLDRVGPFVLVVRAQDRAASEDLLAEHVPGLPVELVVGGATRHASEQAALDHLADRIESGLLDVVAIHDGARPNARPELWRRVLAAARADGGALPSVPATGLLHTDAERRVLPLPAGGSLQGVQTPQAFDGHALLTAYRRAGLDSFTGTDTASCLEAYAGVHVRAVPSTPDNLKVTYPADLLRAATLLADAATGTTTTR